MNNLSTLLGQHAVELARVDDTTYLAVRLVYATQDGGTPELYCAESGWPTTPAARLAAKDAEIAELATTLERQAMESLKQCQRAAAAEARVQELERQLAVRPADPVQSQAPQFAQRAAYVNGADETPPIDPAMCPDCTAAFKNARALQMHRQRAPGDGCAEAEPTG